jgi:hypothetical protein
MATDPIGAAQAALASQLAGKSGREGLVDYRASGGRIASQTWFRLVGEMQAMLASKEGIYNEPTNLRPVASEIQVWTTTKAKGYVQQVEVLARDRDTGQIISIPFSVTGRSLVSRRNAMQQALSIYSDDNASKYNQQILGAVYTGTYEARPAEQ